jgi:hypothetical protein
MNRPSLALLFLLVAGAAAYGQAPARLETSPTVNTETSADPPGPARAIAALKRLERDVVIYRSLGDFEADGRLARISFPAFANDLQAVTTEVEPMLSRMPEGRLKTEIRNALDSYRDGAFWWQKIHQSRVVHVSALTSFENIRTSSDTAFLATVPYTVAIHWRQAGKYLKRAEELMNRTRG